MTEQRRKLGIQERSCGLQSPPAKIKTLRLSKRDGIKVHTCLDHPNHLEGKLKLSACCSGTTASSWICSQQSPPNSKMSVVNKGWNM